MSRTKTLQLGVGLGAIIAGLLAFIFVGIFYYLPKLDQRITILSSRVDAAAITTVPATDGKSADLTPRLVDLEKDYAMLVSIINTKMPNVNLPALISIANAKGMPSANVALAIALIETEPTQAKNYLSQTLSFNDSEVVQVMGPMDRYNKKKVFGNFKLFHRY